MKIIVNENALKATGEMLTEFANRVHISLDNNIWEMSLPTSEQLMMGDAKKEYEMRILGVDEHTYGEYKKISSVSARLEKFYNEDVERLRRLAAVGFSSPHEEEFDINISKEEAYERYLGCDRESGQKIESLMHATETQSLMYEKDIRVQYNGDLASQLGKNKEEYEARAKEFEEKLKGLFDGVSTAYNQFRESEMGRKIDDAMSNFSAVTAEFAERYEKPTDQGPTLK